MQIFVRNLSFGGMSSLLALDVETSDTILNVKWKISDRKGQGIPLRFMCLRFCSCELLDKRTLADYNIQKESTLLLLVYTQGGEGRDEWAAKLINRPVSLDSPLPPAPLPTFTLEFRADLPLDQLLSALCRCQSCETRTLGSKFTDQVIASPLQLLKLSPRLAALSDDAALLADIQNNIDSSCRRHSGYGKHSWQLFTEQMPIDTEVTILQRGSVQPLDKKKDLCLSFEEHYAELDRLEAAGTRWRVAWKVQEALTPGGLYVLYLHCNYHRGVMIDDPMVLPFRVGPAPPAAVEEPFPCSVCLETCVDPVTAGCGVHNFCRDCLADHIRAELARMPRVDAPRCPLCRELIQTSPEALRVNVGIQEAIQLHRLNALSGGPTGGAAPTPVTNIQQQQAGGFHSLVMS